VLIFDAAEDMTRKFGFGRMLSMRLGCVHRDNRSKA
jgi:hypothetical protein